VALSHSPSIVTNGLVLCLDAGNTKSLTKVSRTNLLVWSNKLNRPQSTPIGTDYYGGGYFDGWQNNPADITESDDGYGTYYTTTYSLVWSAYNTLNTAPFTVYTISFLAKSDTIANIRPRLYSNVNGTTSTGDWQSLQTDGTLSLNGWRQFTFVMPATSANNPSYPYPENANANSLVIELSTGSGFSIKNIQVEEGSLATEYIPTLGSSVSIVGYVPTWKDLSGNGNNGTITNSVLYAPTYNSSNGGSLVFDGVDDYAQINGSITLSEATFIAWIKRNGDQPIYAGIVYNRVNPSEPGGNATGLDLSGITSSLDVFNPINQVNYTWNGAVNTFSWDTGLLIPDLTWCMCAVSVTSTSATAYLCQPSGITSSTNVVNHSPATLGNIKIGVDDFTLENRSFKGDIAQASIYNRALTASEIQQNYIATLGRFGI